MWQACIEEFGDIPTIPRAFMIENGLHHELLWQAHRNNPPISDLEIVSYTWHVW